MSYTTLSCQLIATRSIITHNWKKKKCPVLDLCSPSRTCTILFLCSAGIQRLQMARMSYNIASAEVECILDFSAIVLLARAGLGTSPSSR